MTSPLTLFVGTLNRPAPYFDTANGPGLVAFDFDEPALTFTKRAEFATLENPTFLSVAPDGTHVYANSEVFGWAEGLVTAFGYDRGNGQFRYLNTQPTLGSIAAHNAFLGDGMLAVANYLIGEDGPMQSVALYGLHPDGSLTPPLGSAAHPGHGPHPRQDRSHAHCVLPFGANGQFLVTDLGADRIFAYDAGMSDGLRRTAETVLAAGSGPRHMVLDPAQRLVFVLCELTSTLISLGLDATTGALTQIDARPCVPASALSANHCADLRISSDGRFLYASNRGHDSIAIFAVDPDRGRLELRGHVPSGGKTPRSLALTPSGQHLLAANQDSDIISIFARDAATGLLRDTGRTIAIGTPMCVRVAD